LTYVEKLYIILEKYKLTRNGGCLNAELHNNEKWWTSFNT